MVARGILMVGLLVFCAGCGGGSGQGDGNADGADDGTGDGGPVPVTLTSIVPNTGFTAGAATVYLEGTGFLGAGIDARSIRIGTGFGGGLTVLSDTLLSCSAPPGTVGRADVRLSFDDGERVLPEAFMYYRAPAQFLANDRLVNIDVRTTATRTPLVCCDGERVHVVWRDDRHGSYEVFARTSHDGGASWLGPGSRIDAGLPGDSISSDLVIACCGDRIYAAWTNLIDGNSDVYFARSVDAGQTWDAPRRLNTTDAGTSPSYYPYVCCEGDNVYVAWEDRRDSSAAVYFNRSHDSGATWLTEDVRLDGKIGNTSGSEEPRICCENDDVYLVWTDMRNVSPDVYFRRSLDRGATWSTPVPVNTNGGGASYSGLPQMCCGLGQVYVVWQDDRNGMSDIYFNRSADRGTTWQGSDDRLDLDDAGGQYRDAFPRICCSEGRVYVAWTEGDDPGSLPGVHFSASRDGGASWHVEDVLLAPTGSEPRIRCQGPYVHVLYKDTRDGNHDIYMNHSTTGGLTFQTGDIRLDTDDAGSAESREAELCVDGARVHVVWQDRRGASDDTRYQRSVP